MSITVSDELLSLESASWEAQLRLAQIRADSPPRPADWTPEQHEAWDVAWADYADAADEVQAAIRAHAAEAGVSRYELEMATKKAVRYAPAA